MIVKAGQNIFDVIMQGYGSLEASVDLLIANGLTFDSLVEGGQELSVTSSDNSDVEITEFYVRNNAPNNAQNEATIIDLGRITSTNNLSNIVSFAVNDGQGIFDICVQEFGTLEQIINLLTDNSLSFDSLLTSGQQLTINNQNKGINNIKNSYLLNNFFANNNAKKTKELANAYNTTFDNTIITFDSTEATF